MPSKKPWELWERRELKIQNWGQRKQTNPVYFLYLNISGSRDQKESPCSLPRWEGRGHKSDSKAGSTSQTPEMGHVGKATEKQRPRGKVLEVSLCSFLFCFTPFLKGLQNESGKIRRGIYMVFEGFPWFYKYFISSIKRKPLGGVKGRREKVRLCSRLLWSKSRPTPLISAEPLWICRAGSSLGLPGVSSCSLETQKHGSAQLFCYSLGKERL